MNVLTLLVIAFIALVCTLPATAEERPYEVDPEPGTSEPALWMIRDADSAVYLFGTIHVSDGGTTWRTDLFEALDDAAAITVMETTFDPASLQAQVEASLELGMDFDAPPLDERLGPVLAERVRRAAKRLGLPLMGVAKQEPWLMILMLTEFEAQRAGLQGASAIDLQIHHHADADGDQLRGLATPRELSEILAGIPADAQRAWLADTLSSIDGTGRELARVHDAWRTGDLKGIEEVTESFRAVPEVYQRLLTARNRKWVPIIRELLAGSEDVLFCAGVAHFVGPDSVLRLLEGEGLTVKRLQ